MEETLSEVVTDLAELRRRWPPPMPESALLKLQRLVDAHDSQLVDKFFEGLHSRNVSPSFLAKSIGSAIDSGSNPRHYLVASKVYLSLLLSHYAPLPRLFAPMAFASVLHSLWKSAEFRRVIPEEDSGGGARAPAELNRRGAKRVLGSRSLRRNCTDDVEQRLFLAVLKKLVLLMDLIHLDRFPDSLKSLVHTVAELPKMVPDSLCDSRVYHELTDLCSQLLRAALRPEHGDQANSAAEVLNSLSPLIMSNTSEVRTFALSCVTSCMVDAVKECEGVKKAVISLLKHLVEEAVLEKSELRASAVESIMEIFRALECSDDQVSSVE